MFGVTWRATATALFSALAAAIVLRVISPIVDMMNHPNHWLVESFNVLTANVLLLSVLSAMVMFLVGSVGNTGGGVGRGQMKRIAYAHGVTLSMAVAALLFFRFGMVFIDMGTNEHSGMFSSVASLLEQIAPVSIAIILAGTWLWVLISPWQEELRRQEQQRQQPAMRGPR